MPNWCDNSVTITGPFTKIKDMWDAISANDETGLLNALVPLDGEWSYSEAVETWGTKWDVASDGLEFVDNDDGTASITGWFDSAWSPPIEAYDTFLENNDDCTISASYYEMGLDFAGIYENGVNDYQEGLRDQYMMEPELRSDTYKRLDEIYDLSNQFDLDDWVDDYFDLREGDSD